MKKTFDIDKKTYAVISPTAQIRMDSQIEHSRVFGELLKDGKLLTRSKLEDLIEKNEIWDAESKEKYKKLNKEIAELIAALEAGNMKLNKAREIAIEIADKRIKLTELTNEYRQYDDITIDSKAEAAAFDYLVANCCVDNETGDKVFKDFNDYLEHKGEVIASMAHINMLILEYGSADNLRKNLPENKFLLEWKFVDDDLRFVNKEGQYTDRDGKLVDEDGFYVEQEKKEVEKKPFLDEDGNPLEKPE